MSFDMKAEPFVAIAAVSQEAAEDAVKAGVVQYEVAAARSDGR